MSIAAPGDARHGSGSGSGDELTIDRLAARVGMTVRNVRAYASRGLLPPPRLVGRTGYYGAAHVARLNLVRQLFDEGYTLAAVARLLRHAPADASAAELAAMRAVVTPWLPDEPEEIETAALAERAGTAPDERALDTLVKLGVVERAGPGRVRVLNPSLLAAGQQVVRLGLPLEAVLATQLKVTRLAERAATLYVDLVRDTVWREFVDAGRPEERWAGIGSVIEIIQPLAGQALLATFRAAMAEAVETALGEEAPGPSVEAADSA
ncbi:MAG TPA: MerR family transcriptional regulator [Mycobacteriales bacterium]|nr:MerR family transcriptional regulator [Mycobacteriales bacterium]